MRDDDPRDPDLDFLLNVFKEAAFYDLRVGLPGKLVDYDATTQKASVQPLVQDSVIEQGSRRALSLPVIHDVPVFFWGGGGARTTYPVQIGDSCWIWFSSSSLDQWLVKGGEVDPIDDRRHDINDAVCCVGAHDFRHVPTEAPQDATVIWPGDFDVRVGGYAGAEKMVKGETYRNAEDNYFAALEALIAQMLAEPTMASYFLTGAPAAALTAWTAAVTAFHTAASTFLAQKGKVV